MRKSCKLAKLVLDAASKLVKPGVTTQMIDDFVFEMIVSHGAYPSPLNYHGFPKSVCTSVNNVVCHGIPDSRSLIEGDIINIDITVYLVSLQFFVQSEFFREIKTFLIFRKGFMETVQKLIQLVTLTKKHKNL